MIQNTKNGQPIIKDEWRLIHFAIHNKEATKVRLGRKEYEILLSENGCKYIDYDNIRFVQQNELSRSALGRRAKQGERITWCNPHVSGEQPFIIDQHVLLQAVQSATIGLPLKQLEHANIATKADTGVSVNTGGKHSATGSVPAQKPAGRTGKSKKPTAKRSSGSLGKK